MNLYRSTISSFPKLKILWLVIFPINFATASATLNLPDTESLFYEKRYQEVIELLLPNAREGNLDALYLITKALIRQSNTVENLRKAKVVATKCAEKDDIRCKAILSQINTALDKSNSIQSISEMNFGLKDRDLESIHKKILEINPDATRTSKEDKPRRKVLYFFSEFSNELSNLIELDKRTKANRINIQFEFYLVLDPAKPNQAFISPNPNITIPAQGFTPDANMLIARQYGVRTTPQIVFFSNDGSQHSVSSTVELSKLIFTTNLM